VLILQHGEDLVYAFWGAILQGAIPSIMPFLTEKLSPERYRADLSALISVTKPAAIITYPEFEGEVRSALQEGDSVHAVVATDRVEVPAGTDFGSMQGLRRKPKILSCCSILRDDRAAKRCGAVSSGCFNQLQSYGRSLSLTVRMSLFPGCLYHDMGLIAGFLCRSSPGCPWC
jgi:hypothetical protein